MDNHHRQGNARACYGKDEGENGEDFAVTVTS